MVQKQGGLDMANDKLDMIYDLIKQGREESSDFRKEVRESHKSTGEKLNKIQTDTSERLSSIEATNTIQNQQLDEHMRRTDMLETLHKDNEERIIVLEEPGKVRSKLKKWILGLGACAAALVAIGRLLGLY